MKSKFSIFFLGFLIMCIPLAASAGMLKMVVNYKKGSEKKEHAFVDIKDGYWKMPVVKVSKPLEREKYSIVIEGYETIKNHTDTLELIGASVSRNSMLFPMDGFLRVENKENFPRVVTILQEGEKNEKIEITVPPNGFNTHAFSSSGDYTIVDTLFQWNTVYVRVLKSSHLFSIEEGVNKFDIPDISPGSYTIRVYYGTRWIYQEDFVMVSNAPQNLVYKIENSSVSSVGSDINLNDGNFE